MLGAVAFVAAHLVTAAKWVPWFGGQDYPPWFLNDGNRAVLFMVACVFVAALTAGVLWARSQREAFVHGINLAAGAVVAMAVVLFTAPSGPGTLFPIALAVGGCILLLSSVLAAMIVAAFKPRLPRSAKSG